MPKKEFVEIWGLRGVALFLIIICWQGVLWLDLTTEFWISSPVSIIKKFIEYVLNSELWLHTSVTMIETLLGFIIGTVLGVGFAFVVYRWNWLYVALEPFLTAIYSLPRVALAPLFIMWFGIGILSKVILSVSIVFFILFYNTYSGVKSVDKDLVNNVRTMGGSNSLIVRKVILPWCIPWIFSGMKIGLAMSLIGAVVGEMLAAQHGLGFVLARAAGAFETTGVFTVLLILALLAMLLTSIMERMEKHLLKWRQE
ncbi:ABC transporter permease [Neobacillus citreus]|uniref:ABC transporter permease n=1 Tax=Neobacillus citreus TaxID=2833578 RepID=A0A942T3I8_9BACI|nr:ABC transporter permease [Neobacillus citreus]MCH6264345.1 ABC transporter permease [Neobacillus citreus]